MRVVPVVDLMHGQVVRGIAGERQAYRPIVSALCEGSSEPRRVARRLVEHCASDVLYLADLDALQGGAMQAAVLHGLLEELPGVTIWLDAGFADAGAAAGLPARVEPVFASEALRSAEALAALPPTALLSLDRRAGVAMDPAGCWQRPALWPQRVIVMTLERVGAGGGPDLDTLAAVAAQAAPGTLLIGAGGIRDEADLRRAGAAGAAAWLVASALHDLRLPPSRRCT